MEIKLICGLRGRVGAVGRALLVRPDGHGGHLSGGNRGLLIPIQGGVREANGRHQSETVETVPDSSPLSLTRPSHL